MSTWWHGGKPVHGDELLPSTETGAGRSGDLDGVFVTPVRDLAATYAATAENGWLFEVEPVGEVRQDPGSMLPEGQSMVCDRARILRRFKLSRDEAARRRAAVGMFGEVR